MHIYICTSIRAIILWSLKALGQRVLALLSRNRFSFKFKGSGSKGTGVIERKMVFTHWVTVTLTFDQLTPKSNGFFNSKRAITLWSVKDLAQSVLELLSGNSFYSSGHCDLDLWPSDTKINRFLQLNQGYHPMKIKGSVLNVTRVIERKRFSHFGSLWPWPLTYWPQNQ